jgi:hypothetical protein
MGSIFIRLIPASIGAALLIGLHGGTFAPGAPDGVNEASAITAAPTAGPASFSELAPAIVAAPRDAVLPASGYSTPEVSVFWPKFFGATLAMAGLLFVFSALRMHPEITVDHSKHRLTRR